MFQFESIQKQNKQTKKKTIRKEKVMLYDCDKWNVINLLQQYHSKLEKE